MIPVSIPGHVDDSLIPTLVEITTRAIDGTAVPLFVDITNQRVIVGASTSAGSNSKLQVQNGDIEIIGSANGVILTDQGGSGKTCRLQVIYDSASGNWVPLFTTVS